ncbi:hypothetical protein ACYOEI_09165, partial [Singulisphaera rosea]
MILAMALLSTTANSSAADLLTWSAPKTTPQFREILDADTYRRLSTPFDDQLIKARKLARTKYPDHGLRIHGRQAPTTIEASGLGPEDVVIKAEGKELWGRLAEYRRDPIRVQYYSVKADRIRDMRVAIAFQNAFEIVRRPDLVYLRSKDQDPKWDRDVFIGLTATSTDPDLSETAWQHALAAGFPRNRASSAA